MAHSDDEGLVLPPRVAPVVVAIVPIFKSDEERAAVREFVYQIIEKLAGPEQVAAARTQPPTDGIESFFFNRTTHQRIVVDWRDNRPGDKQFHWEQRGVPFRFEVGPRDVAQNVFVLKRRLDREKANVSINDVSAQWLTERLESVHAAMLEKARKFRDENTRTAGSYDEMKKILAEQGGFVRVHFNPDKAKEAKIKDETKATVRCIPFKQSGQRGKDILTGEETETEVLFAQAY
jgi:prolyl-tRNA synthetase